MSGRDAQKSQINKVVIDKSEVSETLLFPHDRPPAGLLICMPIYWNVEVGEVVVGVRLFLAEALEHDELKRL